MSIKRIQNAIDLMEENLTSSISLTEIASEACFSLYHFHRIFKLLVGETAKSYLRKRRLTVAAEQLLSTSRGILDIAIEYQFESQESFTRAFKKQFGYAPGQYRSSVSEITTYKRQELTIDKLNHLCKGVTMEPIIKHIDALKCIGLRKRFSLVDNQFPALWEEFFSHIATIKNQTGIYLGVCEMENVDVEIKEFTDSTEFDQIACAVVSGLEDVPEALISKEIPAGNYAVFTHKGPVSKLKESYDYIYGTWLPTTKEKLRETADELEWYETARFEAPESENNEIDICIPVV